MATMEHLDFPDLLWLLVAAFALHEAEEWNITDFERSTLSGLPETVTKRNARIWIAFICAVAVMWCALATLPKSATFAAYVFLPAIALVLANSLQHIFWTVHFKQYAPGTVTATLLLIPLGSYTAVRAASLELVGGWYLVVLGAMIAVILIETVRAGNRVTPPIRAIYGLGNWLDLNVLHGPSHRRTPQ